MVKGLAGLNGVVEFDGSHKLQTKTAKQVFI